MKERWRKMLILSIATHWQIQWLLHPGIDGLCWWISEGACILDQKRTCAMKILWKSIAYVISSNTKKLEYKYKNPREFIWVWNGRCLNVFFKHLCGQSSSITCNVITKRTCFAFASANLFNINGRGTLLLFYFCEPVVQYN